MNIIKRNGSEVEFDEDKIFKAISGANREVPENDKLSDNFIKSITDDISTKIKSSDYTHSVEDIQDMVEDVLMDCNHKVARRYIRYRYDHQKMRDNNTTDDTILSLVELQNEELKQENSNKNSTINSTQRDYIAGEVSKDLALRKLLPERITRAHKEGIIHFHDTDYFLQKMTNCCVYNLKDMLDNGTVISDTLIESPHMFSTACNITTQIMAQVASNQYGGQTITLSHLAPYVQKTREKYLKKFKKLSDILTDKEYNDFIEGLVHDDIEKGVQIIQYQILTLLTTNGQTPFVSLFMWINEVEDEQTRKDLALIIEEVLHQRIKGVKNEKGVWVTPAFPKLLYCLDDNNIKEGDEYYYLTKLAAKCTAKRMVPDYISAKIMKELKNGDVYPCMGCRSFLTPSPTHTYYSRFNLGVCTINLPDVALSSGGDMDKFWKILDERLELCYEALMCRVERLKGTPSDVAPILWQYGAFARLKKGESIDKLFYNGNATISLGYAGLAECVYYMIGSTHTKDPGKSFGLAVMQRLNDKCAEWKAKENIDFSVYGSPIESTTYKFAKCLQKRFGKIKGVCDKNYITNSYHVKVTEKIDAFSKFTIESEFQKLSPGGAISYAEVPNLQNNLEVVLQLIEHIYNHIMYAELNTKSDYCQVCGFNGEIEIVEDKNKKLIWRCPNCGNTNENKLNVARRTCGYIGSQFWNQGRTQEIKERVLHL